MRLFKNAHFPFVKSRYIAYAISLFILIVGIVGMLTKGLNWSIDFTGGVAMELNMAPADKTVPPVHIDKLRSVLQASGFKDVEIQSVGQVSDSHYLIKTKLSGPDTESKILNALSQSLPQYIQGRDLKKDVVVQIDKVGPKVGDELRSQALFAVLLSLVLMIIYIWIRFELTFGVTAILAIFHDTFCVVGILALTGKEITIQIIAALLTLVGYSINDTIVIYDRIREDLRIYRKDPYETVFNNAMNKTLSRTTITAGTTLASALALYFFGGTVIHDFAFAISIGLIFGTYSSIFVASNLVIDYYHISHQDKSGLQTLTSKATTSKKR
jgi:preprotein translocase SecF subunit